MAMRQALLSVLPGTPPGPTPAQAKAALLTHLAPTLFPDGAKAGWWLKCVQLDLEHKQVITRAAKPPVRLYLSAANGEKPGRSGAF